MSTSISQDPILQEYRVHSSDDISRTQPNGTSTITPAMFEKMYLAPKTEVKGELRRTFANPTPIAMAGIILALTPLAIDLMGWCGAGDDSGNVSSGTGVYVYFAGLLLILGAIGEFLLSNTFPCVVFATFGGFWLSLAATLTSFFNAIAAYNVPNSTAPQPDYYISFAFLSLFMTVINVVYLICASRPNVAFVVIFLAMFFTVAFLTASYFFAGQGSPGLSHICQVTAGACAFIAAMARGWIFLAFMFQVVDFPIAIPLGDLSTVIKGKSEFAKCRMAGDVTKEA